MRQLRERVKPFEAAAPQMDVAKPESSNSITQSDSTNFQALLSQAVDKVNSVQKESSQLSTAFQQGDPNVTLTQVVVASEKAGIAFEAMNEVRNRLVNAYEDIMNMPI